MGKTTDTANREADILARRARGESYREIGAVYGVTGQTVSTIVKRAANRAKNENMMAETRALFADGHLDQIPIDSAALSVRTSTCLHGAGYRTLADVSRASDADLLSISGFSDWSLKELRDWAASFANAPA